MVCASAYMLMLPYVQGNVLITQDGNACLGDLGITRLFADFSHRVFKLATARYMAPEQFDRNSYAGPTSKESDVYCLAMTSFTVRSSNDSIIE